MTAELEAAGKSLFVNEVPEMWRGLRRVKSRLGGGGGMSSYPIGSMYGIYANITGVY